jgi:hypothetical protein
VQINIPSVLAEVRAVFECYERALVKNDIATLDALFWHSELVVRYGIAENLYGIEAVRAFRAAHPANVLGRKLVRTVITSFGYEFATANTEFGGVDRAITGRQSQSWVRLAPGWRIVSAQVSIIPAP